MSEIERTPEAADAPDSTQASPAEAATSPTETAEDTVAVATDQPAPKTEAPRPAATGPAPASRPRRDRFGPPGPAPAPEGPEGMDPRMRKPAVYEPRIGPGPSRFRPRQTMTEIALSDIHYKNVEVLARFIDNQGRILSRRKSRVSAKMQRRIKTAIKQARHLALLPYTPSHIRSIRRR